MFRIIPSNDSVSSASRIEFELDGVVQRVHGEISVAAAVLLVSGRAYRSSPVDGSARAPHCLMGVCGECLVTIDGKRNQLGCQVTLCHGMRVQRQRGDDQNA